jgi:hypothetical protein
VRELFIKDNTLDEARIFESTAGLGDNLDKFEVDIASFEVSNVEHGSHG